MYPPRPPTDGLVLWRALLASPKRGGGGSRRLVRGITATAPWLHQCAAAARADARGATEAMVAGHDLAIVDLVRIDIP
jgi:hypothetical protein